MAVPFTQQDGPASPYCKQVEEEGIRVGYGASMDGTGVAATMRALVADTPLSGRIN
jgi:hypothetical protein